MSITDVSTILTTTRIKETPFRNNLVTFTYRFFTCNSVILFSSILSRLNNNHLVLINDLLNHCSNLVTSTNLPDEAPTYKKYRTLTHA